jgi:hypothetical protein
MKLNDLSCKLPLIVGLLMVNFFLSTDASAKEEAISDAARSNAQVGLAKEPSKDSPQKEFPLPDSSKDGAKEGIKDGVKEVVKEGGKESGGTEAKKQLPPCKGSYSKVKWTECRGVKREYNGPNFVGQSYEGDFLQGRPHGQGDMRYHDGTRFVGAFEMGVRDGPGTEYAKDGSLIREGFWRAGVLVKTYKTGAATSEGNKEK